MGAGGVGEDLVLQDQTPIVQTFERFCTHGLTILRSSPLGSPCPRDSHHQHGGGVDYRKGDAQGQNPISVLSEASQ